MTPDNISTVQRALDAYASGDLSAFFAHLHPDVEWIGAREFPDAQAFHGHNGVREALRLWSEVWGLMVLRPSELIRADDERVLAVGEADFRAAETGLEFTFPMALLAGVRDRQMVYVQFFLDLDEARAAAGLA